MNILKKFWNKKKPDDIYKNTEKKIEIVNDPSINIDVEIKEVKIKKIIIKQ